MHAVAARGCSSRYRPRARPGRLCGTSQKRNNINRRERGGRVLRALWLMPFHISDSRASPEFRDKKKSAT